jgi:hypothetical protein
MTTTRPCRKALDVDAPTARGSGGRQLSRLVEIFVTGLRTDDDAPPGTEMAGL